MDKNTLNKGKIMKYLMIIMFLTSCNTNLKDTYEN